MSLMSCPMRSMVVGVSVALAFGCTDTGLVAPGGSPSDPALVRSGGSTSTLGVPTDGVVMEGASVPGVSLGFSRAQVEAVYGEPQSCQSGSEPGDNAHCSFAVSGGGQVSVGYRGVDGGNAQNASDDVVHHIRWSEAVDGWVTTAGVSTALAKNDPDAVIAAYPNAEVTYTQFGGLYSVVAHELGVEVVWAPDFYAGTVHVNMAIFAPREPPPATEQTTRVTEIDLSATKGRGRRTVRAFVRVQKETDLAAAGSVVSVRWTLPDGTTQTAADVSSNAGYAYFEIVGGARGTYRLTIDDVALDGHRFDRDNSVLTASLTVR